jgi:1-acyl-sn-glycerol-3-phosphate acyltransferase
VIVVANHSSHADTVLLQFALATCHEQPVLVAGAEDYWFRNPLLGALAQALGVIAFPRKGEVGVHRVARALNRRASVVLFPQGSRSGGRFRAGIGRIARRSDAEVLPVHVAGTQELLPKGRIWPQRTDIVVRFGEPITPKPSETPEAFAARLERIVLVDLGKAA